MKVYYLNHILFSRYEKDRSSCSSSQSAKQAAFLSLVLSWFFLWRIFLLYFSSETYLCSSCKDLRIEFLETTTTTTTVSTTVCRYAKELICSYTATNQTRWYDCLVVLLTGCFCHASFPYSNGPSHKMERGIL